jgi:hypothetical protein
VSEPPRHRSATRREILTAGAAAGAAALAAPGLLPTVAAAASGSGSSPPTDDGARLERVLSMAVLAAYVYEQVFAEGVLTQSQRRALDGFDEQEHVHVVALRRAAATAGGTTTIRPPSSLDVANQYLAHRGIGGRLGQLKGSDDALDLLVSVERSSIGSCYVALLGLTGSAAIVLVAQIMANDAQHEAVVTLERPTLTLTDAAPFPLVSGSH